MMFDVGISIFSITYLGILLSLPLSECQRYYILVQLTPKVKGVNDDRIAA